MNRFRLLRADEIECRVSQIKENGLTLLLYKTARTDANLLDETVGDNKWTNDFKLVDGVLYGGIGVDYGNGYVWKWDAGVESNTEAEKGRASDAFKRAGFKHGIGRELYTAPFVGIDAAKCNIRKNSNGKLACYDTFSIERITYTNQEISGLSIINEKTRKRAFVWSSGEPVNVPAEEPKPAETAEKPPTSQFVPRCADCKAEISEKVHDYSVRYFKRPLCRDCQERAKNESANR